MLNKTLVLNETSTSTSSSNQSKSIVGFVYQNTTKIIKLNNDVSFLDPVLSLGIHCIIISKFLTKKISKLILDNHAKEIILLSTAFVTMLLSTCFMLFLIWFCCYIACKDRNSKMADKRVKKSIHETETNLNEIGLNLKQQSTYYDNDDKTEKANDFEYLRTVPNSHKTIVEKAYNTTDLENNCDLINTVNIKNTKKSKLCSLKKQKLDEKLLSISKVDNSKINEAYADTEDDMLNNYRTNAIDKHSTLKNRPRLTPSQIEKEFYEYTLECSKHFGDLLQSDAQSNTISLDTFDYLESTSTSMSPNKKSGIYSHNLKVKNKNRISHIRTAFNSENKNLSSQIKICKVKSIDNVIKNANNDDKKEQIWHI